MFLIWGSLEPSNQSSMHENNSNTMEELRDNVTKAFWEMDPFFLEKTWVTWQSCMIESLKVQRSNKYKIPHMGKDKIFKSSGALPDSLSFSPELYAESKRFIDSHEVDPQAVQRQVSTFFMLPPIDEDDDSSEEGTHDVLPSPDVMHAERVIMI